MPKIQAPVIMNEAPASDEYGVVVRPIGGTGGGDVTIVAPLPLPVEIVAPIGPNTKADSVSVTLATDEDSISVNTKGPLTPTAPTAVSVGITPTLVLAANASRKGVRIVNTSNAIVSLAIDNIPVLESGMTLTPFGVFNMDEYDFSLGEINGIASLADSNVGVQEFV